MSRRLEELSFFARLAKPHCSVTGRIDCNTASGRSVTARATDRRNCSSWPAAPRLLDLLQEWRLAADLPRRFIGRELKTLYLHPFGDVLAKDHRYRERRRPADSTRQPVFC